MSCLFCNTKGICTYANKNKPCENESTCEEYTISISKLEQSNLPQNYLLEETAYMFPSDVVSRMEKIIGNITDFVWSNKRLCYLIYSVNHGTGKTKLAFTIASEYLKTTISSVETSTYFIDVPTLLLKYRQSINTPAMVTILEHKLTKTPLLVLDDITCLPLKDYDFLVLRSIIERRLNSGLVTIFTATGTLKTIEEHIGSSLSSRIINGGSSMEIKLDDRRGC